MEWLKQDDWTGRSLLALAVLGGCAPCSNTPWYLFQEVEGSLLIEPRQGRSISFEASGMVSEDEYHRFGYRLIADVEQVEQSDDTGGDPGILHLTWMDGDVRLVGASANCGKGADQSVWWMEGDSSELAREVHRNITLRAQHVSGDACTIAWLAWASIEGPMCCKKNCPGAPEGSGLELRVEVEEGAAEMEPDLGR
jgi:hypothetical protein